MLARWTTPRILWTVFVLSALVSGGLQTLERLNPGNRATAMWSGGIFQFLHVSAYMLALWLCLKILADHRAPSTMRLAWLLMAGCAALSILRHAFELFSVIAGWIPAQVNTYVGFRQIPIVLALLFLTAGLAAMWSSFAAIGLGLRFSAADLPTICFILVFVPWVFSLRGVMNDSHSVYPAIRTLQSASPMLLAAPALAGLALHRISQEMGGGQLAVSLRYLVAYPILRLGALLMQLSPAIGTWPASAAIGQAMVASSSWLFVLAVASRWRLTLSAEQLAARYERDPAAEIAHLTGRARH